MIGRDLLGIEDLERSEIERLLDTADHMREIGEREVKKVPTLRGRTIINLFFESSHAHAHQLRDRRQAALGRRRSTSRRRPRARRRARASSTPRRRSTRWTPTR